MKKTSFFLPIILLMGLLLLGSCEKEEFKPESIHLQHADFSVNYTVDQELTLDGVKLRLVNGKGQYRDVPCTTDMIVGFDTSTTGQKKLHAVYAGLTSNEISYLVYNKEDASRPIVTKTRIDIQKTVSEDKTIFELNLRSCDIAVRAFSFRITGIDASFDDGLSEVTGTVLGKMTDYYWKKTTNDGINVLISGNEPQSTGAFFSFEWTGTNRSIRIEDIVVSDGENDYFLPAAK